MVKTNIQTFTGEVEVLEEFYVGSNLVANDVATHVLTVNNPANDAKIKSDFFVGDGGLLSNIATTLQSIADQGNTASNVIIFNSNTDVTGYKNVGFVTTSNVGIQNTAPTHTLSIGDKVFFSNNTNEALGQSVMVVEGRINATRFQGDGGLLSNIATTLESIADQGNASSNVLIFNSNVDIPGYKGIGFVTTSNVGIQNTNPGFNTLSVGSNLFVNIYGSNVLTVHGNAAVSNLLVSEFSVSPAHNLQDVTLTGRHSTQTVQLTNTTTGLEVTSNINVAGEVIITDATRGLDVTSNIELGGRLKFDTNVFVDTLRVADMAANIVTYDRTTGELLDSSGTFMNKFAVVSEQPPSDLFANTTTVTNHGGYTLTTSNLATNSNTYNAFDGTANAWVSGGLAGGYIGGSNVFLDTNLTQLSNLHPTRFGDWLAIEFPYKTTLRHMKLTPLTAAQFPARANVYATNNDITWSEVKYWGSATDTSLDLNPVTDSNVQTIVVNATEQFKKYALVATKAAGNSSNVAIQDWQLFTESFSIDGGKVAMAQQAATGGETVMDQSGPHGRDGTDSKKYPEITFEDGIFEFNDSTNTYVQGGYTVTSSSQETEILRSKGLIGTQGYTLFTGAQDLTNADGSYGIKGMQGTAANANTPRNRTAEIPSGRNPKSSGALTPTGTRFFWADLGDDICDEWGMWYIYNPADQTASHIQFGTLNGPTGTVYTETQTHHSKTFTIKHGWILQGIFKLDVECSDPSFQFTIGMYGNMGSDSTTTNEDYAVTAPWGKLNYNFNRTNSGTALNTDPFYTYLIPKRKSDNSAITLSGTNFTAGVTTTVQDNDNLAIWFDTLQVGATMYFVKGASGNITTSHMRTWIINDITDEGSPWNSFDDIKTGSSWSSKYGTHYNGTSPANSYTGTTHQLGTGTDYGEWLKLELPHKIKVTKFTLCADDINKAPISYKIYGSVSGTSWTELKSVSHEAPSIAGNSHEINDTTAYKYVAIVVTQVNTDQANIRIGELKVYGNEILEGGDTSVDTTFTSIMNTPQTTGAKVYVDGSLGGDANLNRVVGPTVANTAATYNETGKYWTLNGQLTSNITVEANTFLSGDSPHSVSVWFNSSNLEANASNSCILSLNSGEVKYDHAGTVVSNTYQTVQKIKASDGAANERFGQGDDNNGISMSEDGSVAVVGAFYDGNFDGNRKGAAYVFVKDANGVWNEVQKLTASDGEAEDRYGCSTDVSSDGAYIVVGSYLAHSSDGNTADIGAAYVYKRTTGTNTWTQQQILNSSSPSASGQFGRRVSISGDGAYIVCNEQNADPGSVTDQGAVYVFKRSGETWGTPTVLTQSDGATSDFFGTSIDISSDTNYIAVGAAYEDGVGTNDDGSVYIFNRTGDNTWSQQQKINNPDVSGNDNYFGGENNGVSISSDGTYLIVGAYGRASNNGAVFFFKRTGSSWAIMGGSGLGGASSGLYTNPTGNTGQRFGRCVTMSSDGSTALVHCRDNGNFEAAAAAEAGAVFMYNRSGNTWTHTRTIRHKDRSAYDKFGNALAISSDGSYFIAGMWNDDDLGDNAGAAYIYTRDTIHHHVTDLNLQANTWYNLTYAYQGEGGSRVTYLDGRKVAEHKIKDSTGEFPPFQMTGYSQAGYEVSSSGEIHTMNNDSQAWRAFYDGGTGQNQDEWVSSYYKDEGGLGAIYTGTNYTYGTKRNNSIGGVRGEWIKMKFPDKIVVSSIDMTTDHTWAAESARLYTVLGSDNDDTWTIIRNVQSGDGNGTALAVSTSPSTGTVMKGIVNATRGYKYIAIVVTQLANYDHYIRVPRIRIFGHRENDLVRFPDPTRVLKYPHIAMTTETTSPQGPQINPGMLGDRGYEIIYSNHGGTPQLPSRVFDGKTDSTTNPNDCWMTSGGTYNTGDGALASGQTHALTIDGTSRGGSWVGMKMPRKLKLSSVVYYPRHGYGWEIYNGYVVGSNNGTSWDSLLTISAQTGWAANTPKTFTMTNNLNTYYQYFAILATHVQANNTAGRFAIQELEFYGTEEASSIPIQIGGGNIDKVANFRVYDKFIGEDQALEIWDAQKDEFGRAKSSMTLQKGRLGLGTTEPEGRLAIADEPHAPEEFPPRALTGYKTFIEGHGEFCVSASNVYNEAYTSYKAFNKISSGASTNWWSQSDDTTGGDAVPDYDLITGDFDGANMLGIPSNSTTWTGRGAVNPLYTTNVEGVSKYGHWLQIEFPYKINYHYSEIEGVHHAIGRQPHTGYILGSNDLTGQWTSLHRFTNMVRTHKYESLTYTPPTVSTETFRYFRIVIEKLGGGNAHAGLNRWDIFGTREQGQSVLHDGQLTLTKNLNVPRIGPDLDMDNTPRRDRLVVEYNTSTNPIVEGYVKDTSGRGFHGVLVGNAYYDPGEKSLRFDGSGDYTEARLVKEETKGAWVHSVSCWVKGDIFNGEETVWNIGDKSGQASGVQNSTSTLSINSASPTLRWYFYSNDASTTLIPNGGIKQHQWYHIVCVYHGGDVSETTAELFLDGKRIVFNGFTATGQALNFDASRERVLMLGRLAWGTSSDLDGGISNFKLWDCALTHEEAKILYDMGRCDEGHHTVNFSKTRVGIGLRDGDIAETALNVMGDVSIDGRVQRAGGARGLQLKVTEFQGSVVSYSESQPLTGNFLYQDIITLTPFAPSGITSVWQRRMQVSRMGSLVHLAGYLVYQAAASGQTPYFNLPWATIGCNRQHRAYVIASTGTGGWGLSGVGGDATNLVVYGPSTTGGIQYNNIQLLIDIGLIGSYQ